MNGSCSIYCQDLWPEIVEIINGIKNKHLIGLITKMVMHIYDNYDYIFLSSKSFVKSISEFGVSIQKLNIGLSL